MIRPIHLLPLLGIAYCITQAPAHANTLSRSTMDGFGVNISGKTATFGWESPSAFSTRLSALPPAGSLPASTVGSTALRAGADGVYAVTTASPTLGGKLVPITATAKLTPASVGKALGKFAFKVATPISVGLGLLELAKDLGIGLRDKDGFTEWYTTTTSSGNTPTMRWSVAGNEDYRFDADGACQYSASRRGIEFISVDSTSDNFTKRCIGQEKPYPASPYANITGKMMCKGPNGWFDAQLLRDGSYSCGAAPETKEVILTEQELADKIAAQSGWPSSAGAAAASNATAAAINAGQSVETATPPQISGPASSEVSKKTTTGTDAQGNPTSKTETTTNNYNYAGNTVTTTQSTTVVNNITNKVESKTDTEEDKEDPPPTDTALPALPKLYERKYPDGIEGVWKEKSAELKTSPVMTLAKTMFPQVSGGTCPRITLPLEFASWANFGTADISPDCAIWGFGRLIIVCSALLLARSLVFGG